MAWGDGPQLTFEGVIYERVPNLSPMTSAGAEAAGWNTEPAAPIAYQAVSFGIRSPPVNHDPWTGASTDQGQIVQLEIRWPPASVMAAHSRALLVVDFTGIPEFLTEPVAIASIAGEDFAMGRGYGFDVGGGGDQGGAVYGYGWNWRDASEHVGGVFGNTTGPAFALDPSQFPGLYTDWTASNNIDRPPGVTSFVCFHMARDHYSPLMIQPVDFSPAISDPADGGGYMFVRGDVLWPAGHSRPTPYFYLPVADAPPPPPPPPPPLSPGISAGRAITGVVRKQQGRVVGLSSTSKPQITGTSAPPPPSVTFTIPGPLALSVGTRRWIPTSDGEIASITLHLIEAPRPSSPHLVTDSYGTVFALNHNGIGDRLLAVFNNQNWNFDPTGISFQAGDIFTIDIIQVGTGFPGADATITFNVA